MSPCSVVILCAGIGERLRPLTYNTNKSLLEVAGKALIEHFLDTLVYCRDHGVSIGIVHIVIGHYGHKFRKLLGSSYQGLEIRFHENTLYKVTGAAQSLYTVSDVLRRGPCLVLEGDHYLHPELMLHLLTSDWKARQCENVVLVDEDKKRLKLDEEVVAYGYQGMVEHLQWLPPYPENPLGEALTIFKLGAKASSDLAAVLENYLLEPGPAKREIVEPMNRLLEMHDMHYALTTGFKWIEVDTPADLEEARKLKW